MTADDALSAPIPGARSSAHFLPRSMRVTRLPRDVGQASGRSTSPRQAPDSTPRLSDVGDS